MKTSISISDSSLTIAAEMLATSLGYQQKAIQEALDPNLLRPRILLAELVRRRRGERILIVTPPHALEKMQHEMWTRFAIPFVRFDSQGVERVRQKLPANRNPFTFFKRVIISIDAFKQECFVHDLHCHQWDAVVIDESHNVTNSAMENNRLTRILAPNADALILASATPHKDYNGPFRLRGGAGTGKTVVALHRARRLALADPSSRVLLTTFTKNLAHDLDAGLRSLDPSLPRARKLGESGVLVQGLDALANHVLRSAGEEVSQAVAAVLGTGRVDVQRRTPAMAWEDALTIAGSDLPEPLHSRRFMESEYQLVVLPSRITTEEEYLRTPRPGRGVRLTRRDRKAVWAVVAAYRQAARMAGSIDFAEAAAIAAVHLDSQGTRLVRHVLVDEGQDFSPCHWQFVRSLVADGGNDIFIVEDGHQRIYGHRIALSRYGIRTQGRSRRLTLNYRTTKQNLDWAVSVLSGHEFVDSEGETDTVDGYCSARGGPVPRVLSVPSAQEEFNVAKQQLTAWLEQGRAPESLAVLVRDKAMRQRVVEGLAEREIQSQAIEAGGVSPGKVAVLTMHRAKGMEFACVLLHGLSEKSIPMGLEEYGYDESDKSEALLRERSLIYVAASRARDELVITYSGIPSPLLPDSHVAA